MAERTRKPTAYLRNFNKIKTPVMWNDTFVNPPKLNLKNLKIKKKITEVKK